MRIKICMLHPLRFSKNMRIDPQLGICSYLTNFGHEIAWVIVSEEHRSTQQFLYDGIYVYAIPYIHYLRESTLIGKIYNQVPSTFKKIYLTLKVFREHMHKYNLILVRDNPLDGLVACYIKKKYKIPFVYELTNPLELEWEAHKIEGEKPIFFWYLMSKIKLLLTIYIMKKADLILPTTKWFEKGLVRNRIPKSKLFSYPNGVDIKSFLDNEDGIDICEKYCLGNTKVVIYIGTMAKVRGLNMLILAFSKVKKECEGAKLLMVGDGTDRKNLEKLTGELKMENDVIFIGQVPQSEVPNFIAMADIGVSPIPPLSFYKVSSPIKMLEYMVMGKPVVANEEILEHKEIIEQSGGGILVPFNDKAFANAIITLLNNSEMAKERGRKGHKWVLENRSFEILTRNVEKRFIQLIKEG